jgi:ABC-2 type transport system permease protein
MGRLLGLALYSLAFFVILELMLVAAILYWPSFAENVDAARSLLGGVPIVADMLEELEDAGVLGYIALQHFFKGCNTLGTAAAVLFAAGAVAGEVHRGTLEILLARPYSRARILTERYLAGILAFGLPIFATSATIPWLAERVDEVVELETFLLGSVHQTIFLLAIYSATFLLSTMGSNPTRIALGALFVTTFLFAIYMIKVVTHYSLYRLCDLGDFQRIDETGGLDWGVLGPLAGVSAALFVASLLVFRRRVP